MLGKPPACLGAERGCGASSQRAGVGHGAEGKVQLSEKSEVLTAALGRRHAHELRGGEANLTEPLPEGTGLTAAGPGITIEAEELDVLDIPHRLTGKLGQGVVEQVEDGQATQVTERFAVDLSDAVVMDKEAVQVDQASEHILREGTDAVSMQEKMGEVDQIREQVILQEVELILLEQNQNTQKDLALSLALSAPTA